MTRKEFVHNIDAMGNAIDFTLHGRLFSVGYIPVWRGEGVFGFDEIGICQEPCLHEEHVQFFKTADDMLNHYLVDGKPLGEQLDKIENMHGIPCA